MPVLQIVIIFLIVGIRGLRQFLAGGVAGINYWSNILLVIGWGIGWFMAELDHLLYALMCNPQELSCQRIKNELDNRRYRAAWVILQETKLERTKLPVHNAASGLLVAILGVWMVTSSGSPLGAGVVLGLSIKLFADFVMSENYAPWYWIIARPITPTENKIVKIVWGLLLGIMVLSLLR